MDLRQEPRRQPRAAGGLDPPGRARNPAFAGSPGGTPRGRSRTGRSRRLSSRLPSSSATVGTRTGDIASRSPPSRALSARTVPRAPVRPVLPFPLRRTTPGPAGWRTTTPGSSPPGRRATRKPPYPAPWTGITRTSPPETAAARSRARQSFAGSPSTSVAAPARTGLSATRPPDRPPPGSSPCRSPAAPRTPCRSPLRRVWSDRSSHSPLVRQGVPPVGPPATICWNHHIPLHRIAPRGKPRRVSWHLEPGAGLGAAAPGGPPGGGAPVDMPARPRRPQGRGRALAAPAPPAREAEPQGRGPRGPGAHPGPGGHPGASGAGGGEGADRRPGGGHESTARAPAGPWCRWWTGPGGTRSCGGPAAGPRPRSGPP